MQVSKLPSELQKVTLRLLTNGFILHDYDEERGFSYTKDGESKISGIEWQEVNF